MQRGGGGRSGLARILEDARRPLARKLNARFLSMNWAGAELGFWAFAANAIMVRSAPACPARQATALLRIESFANFFFAASRLPCTLQPPLQGTPCYEFPSLAIRRMQQRAELA